MVGIIRHVADGQTADGSPSTADGKQTVRLLQPSTHACQYDLVIITYQVIHALYVVYLTNNRTIHVRWTCYQVVIIIIIIWVRDITPRVRARADRGIQGSLHARPRCMAPR